MSKLQLTLDPPQATITINYPEKLNSLDQEMLQSLGEMLEQVARDEQVRVLILQGAGHKAFSAGGNLKNFQALSVQEVAEWIQKGQKVFNQLENLPKPTLALIRGYALGGGLELALACDFRLATPDACLAFPELQHGWIPGWGGLSRLRRLVGEVKAKQMIFMGERIQATQALDWGLINQIIAPEKSKEIVDEFLKPLYQLDLFVFNLAKNALHTDRNTQDQDILFDILATQYSKYRST
ncbi:MAG: enoyl-CoA hydratase/isomerase family protein [Candidatus Cyclobacteriaceae bacterium M3_2C_046]